MLRALLLRLGNREEIKKIGQSAGAGCPIGFYVKSSHFGGFGVYGHKGDITIPCPRRLTPLHVLRRRRRLRRLRRRNRFLHCRRLCERHHFQLVTGIRGENKLLSLWVEYTFSFQYLLSSVVDVDSFLAGFLAQANVVERVPIV